MEIKAFDYLEWCTSISGRLEVKARIRCLQMEFIDQLIYTCKYLLKNKIAWPTIR